MPNVRDLIQAEMEHALRQLWFTVPPQLSGQRKRRSDHMHTRHALSMEREARKGLELIVSAWELAASERRYSLTCGVTRPRVTVRDPMMPWLIAR
jgi:hypothetical protein